MTAGLMSGKRGLVMGVANDHSIAWGIAKRLAAEGAELAFTYQPPSLDKRVRPLAKSLGSDFVIPCDVGLECDADNVASLDSVFGELGRRWGTIDFVVHAIAFSDKNELKGRYADTTRANFARTMVISCFSFTEVAKRAAGLMTKGGSMLTLTYGGSTRVMPNYNVMGVAKAALEASRALPRGRFRRRQHPRQRHFGGPGADARRLRRLRRAGDVQLPEEELAAPADRHHRGDRRRPALYLLSDLSSAVTGEIHFVDSGYNIVSMPRLDELKAIETPEVPGSEAAE